METRSLLEGLPKRRGGFEKEILPLRDLLKGSSRRRVKDATAATIDRSVANAPSEQPLIVTKQPERISATFNFPVPLYTIFLQLQSYLDASSALVE